MQRQPNAAGFSPRAVNIAFDKKREYLFELGLAVALKLQSNHEFRLLEGVRHRLDQSLSDLKGYDAYIHGGTAQGVFDAVRNMFAGLKSSPVSSRTHFRFVYETLRRFRRAEAGRGDPYTAVQFGTLVMTARGAVQAIRRRSM